MAESDLHHHLQVLAMALDLLGPLAEAVRSIELVASHEATWTDLRTRRQISISGHHLGDLVDYLAEGEPGLLVRLARDQGLGDRPWAWASLRVVIGDQAQDEEVEIRCITSGGTLPEDRDLATVSDLRSWMADGFWPSSR